MKSAIPKNLSAQKRDLETEIEELRAGLGKAAETVPPTVHHKPATLGEQVKALAVEVSRLRYAAKKSAPPRTSPTSTKTRRVNPLTATAEDYGVKSGMADAEVEKRIEAATSQTMPVQGKQAVAELNATANAIAHLNVRVAGRLRAMAAELEEMQKG